MSANIEAAIIAAARAAGASPAAAADIAALADRSGIMLDQNGQVTGAAEAVQAFKAAGRWSWFAPEVADARGMTDAEFAASLNHIELHGTAPPPAATTATRPAAAMTDAEFASALAHLHRTGSLPA